MAEITNLIWGAFKNRYIGDGDRLARSAQVPLIVNHKHKYISFGTSNPQLCFRFTLTDAGDTPLDRRCTRASCSTSLVA